VVGDPIRMLATTVVDAALVVAAIVLRKAGEQRQTLGVVRASPRLGAAVLLDAGGAGGQVVGVGAASGHSARAAAPATPTASARATATTDGRIDRAAALATDRH